MRWFDRIVRAIRLGHFVCKERDLAWGWNTCAVGEVLEAHGLPVNAKPYRHGTWCQLVESIDPKLDKLGLAFHRAVLDNKVDRALEIYAEIQEYEQQ